MLTRLILAAIVILGLNVASAAIAADRPDPSEPVAENSEITLKAFLEQRAILYTIRTFFDIVLPDEIRDLLVQDALNANMEGLSDAALEETSVDLLIEGAYFLVSLDYLVRSGFPSWPTDKPEATYRNDALALLRDLKSELVTTIETGRDVLPTFEKIEKIYWWTEGYAEAPDLGVSFSNRDELVSEALAAIAAEEARV